MKVFDFAHTIGIKHLDIKSANLHVAPSGQLTILDFGIARLAALRMTSMCTRHVGPRLLWING